MQRQRFPFVFTSDMADLLQSQRSNARRDHGKGRCDTMLQEFEQLCGRAFNVMRVRAAYSLTNAALSTLVTANADELLLYMSHVTTAGIDDLDEATLQYVRSALRLRETVDEVRFTCELQLWSSLTSQLTAHQCRTEPVGLESFSVRSVHSERFLRMQNVALMCLCCNVLFCSLCQVPFATVCIVEVRTAAK